MKIFLIFYTHFQSLYILSYAPYSHHCTARQSHDETYDESVGFHSAFEGEKITYGDIYHNIRYEDDGHQNLYILQATHNADRYGLQAVRHLKKSDVDEHRGGNLDGLLIGGEERGYLVAERNVDCCNRYVPE